MAPEVHAAIARLRAAWDDEVRASVRRAALALSFAVLFGVAHVARIGSGLARGVAGASLLITAVAIVAGAMLGRRRLGDARRVVRATVSSTDPDLGAATLRAMTLVDRAAVDPIVGSADLATLHLSRLFGRVSTEKVVARASEIARVWSTAGLLLAGFSLAAVVIDPFRVVEGLDVLVARDGRAPLGLTWIDDVDMVSKPPDYLHQSEEPIPAFEAASVPRGATVTVRGRPIHAGRSLVLTDGHTEVPFVDDGSSALVARWVIADSATLFVAARFGGVIVRQLDEQPVTSIADLAPKVVLEGAPRTVRLIDEPDVSIHYEASDDHGLREVDLVLRAGLKEERRGLSRPQAEVKIDRGGYELHAKDPFLRHASTPVEVTVEARDNDPVAGPKWGKSEALLLVPPDVGEPEALRYEGLLRARDAVTDLLADRLIQKAPAAGAAKAHRDHEMEVQEEAKAAVLAAISRGYGGLRLRGRAVSLIRGQLRRLDKALATETKAPAGEAHQKLIGETEGVLLAFDGGVRSIAVHDARSVAMRLAEVAEDGAGAAAALVAASGDLAAPTAKLDASLGVLGGGGKQLLRLGDLGLDLGEIVVNDLRRVGRARDAKDMMHAELALRDLAARLRKPEPSFAGGGGAGASESGGSGSSPGDTPPSPGDAEGAALAQELEQLANDQSGEVGDVEDALEKAASPEELEALKQEAKQHAEAIREAIKDLPRRAIDPGTAESAAADGREQAEAMAGALERGEPGSAIDRGKSSSRALGEAKRIGEQSGGFFPEERAGREAGKVRETIERELEWAEHARERLRKGASDRAKGALDKSGEEQGKLADRARKLGEKGESGDTTLPQETLDHLSEAEQAMRDAKKALKEGDGEGGLERQKQAQRMLEMAKESMTDDEDDRNGRDSGDGKEVSKQKQDIPGKDKHKGPDEFRRRVIEGLGGPGDPMLKQAVKRYAEGLLR